ncbi:hypothetical protein Tco_0542674 [Tanacetum coccineum]
MCATLLLQLLGLHWVSFRPSQSESILSFSISKPGLHSVYKTVIVSMGLVGRADLRLPQSNRTLPKLTTRLGSSGIGNMVGVPRWMLWLIRWMVPHPKLALSPQDAQASDNLHRYISSSSIGIMVTYSGERVTAPTLIGQHSSYGSLIGITQDRASE